MPLCPAPNQVLTVSASRHQTESDLATPGLGTMTFFEDISYHLGIRATHMDTHPTKACWPLMLSPSGTLVIQQQFWLACLRVSSGHCYQVLLSTTAACTWMGSEACYLPKQARTDSWCLRKAKSYVLGLEHSRSHQQEPPQLQNF